MCSSSWPRRKRECRLHSSAFAREYLSKLSACSSHRTLKRTIPVNTYGPGGSAPGVGHTMSGVPGAGRYGAGGGRGPGAFNRGPPTAGGYTCNRCGKTGHIAKYCPTVGDASFDPEIRLMNVPKTGRKVVSSLDGIDTSTSTVIQRSDGSYEVFESSARGLEKLTKEGYVLLFPCSFCFRCAITLY
jgi:hypothetical protein